MRASWKMQVLFVLPAGFVFLLHGATIGAASNEPSGWKSLLYIVLSIALWTAAVNLLAFPAINRINHKLAAATSLSEKLVGISGAVAVCVSLVFLFCAGGSISASLGGVRFARLPCSAFTSFGPMHVVMGIGAVALPLVVAGVLMLPGVKVRKSAERWHGRS